MFLTSFCNDRVRHCIYGNIGIPNYVREVQKISTPSLKCKLHLQYNPLILFALSFLKTSCHLLLLLLLLFRCFLLEDDTVLAFLYSTDKDIRTRTGCIF